MKLGCASQFELSRNPPQLAGREFAFAMGVLAGSQQCTRLPNPIKSLDRLRLFVNAGRKPERVAEDRTAVQKRSTL